jgi:nicotinate-nucleotide adenylyltransferase
VLLVPANVAPHKAGERGAPVARDPGPQHRLRMCQLLADGVPELFVCDLEVERGGMSYTVDTLQALHASHPTAQLTLILGADTAGTLGGWREPELVRELAHLAVAARTGAPRARVLDAIGGDVRLLEMPPIDVSSSLVRERAALGEPIEELVGAAVAGYIGEHRLYGARAEALR